MFSPVSALTYSPVKSNEVSSTNPRESLKLSPTQARIVALAQHFLKGTTCQKNEKQLTGKPTPKKSLFPERSPYDITREYTFLKKGGRK